MIRYLIRLDDASPFMDGNKWQRIEDVLTKYGIKPLVGIIPDNKDTHTMTENEDISFWEKARRWEQNGWSICLHGYDHVYISNDGLEGLNPMWSRSEFSGVPFSIQCEKIKKGIDILEGHNLHPKCFFAPSHTFDENTLKALKQESHIRIVSDTIGRFPYRSGDFFFLPQISGHCVEIPLSGIYTFCIHPNNMDEDGFSRLEKFINEHATLFISFDQIEWGIYGKKGLLDKMLAWAFFKYRQIRRLR